MPHIRFGEITRGHGKVYVRLRVPDVAFARLESNVMLRDGARIPSRVCHSYDGEYVAVLPALSVRHTLSVTAYAADGSVCARGTLPLFAKALTLVSRANTALHNQRAEQIRNCDDRADEHGMTVLGHELWPGYAAPPDRLHTTVRLSSTSPAQLEGPLSICAIGRDGAAPAGEQPVVVGDVVVPNDALYGVSDRLVTVSTKLWPDASYVALELRTADGELSCMSCLEPFMLDELRLQAATRTTRNEDSVIYPAWRAKRLTSAEELEMQRQLSRKLVEERRAAAGATDGTQAEAPKEGAASQTSVDGARRPLFSLVVPLFRTPLPFLREMIDSVLHQTYTDFELVLVNASPDEPELCATIADYASRDDRLRIVTLQGNRGITENTAAGVEQCTGEFVCFFDHDDLLEPEALYCYACAIAREPEIDLLYCDEDKVCDGAFSYPFFKPDWSPIWLESNNYVCHLLTIRRSLLGQIGMGDARFDGAQDHRLTLLAGLRARKVHHERRILYHWRIHALSTAGNALQKADSLDAGLRALEEYASQLGAPLQPKNMPGHAHYYLMERLWDEMPPVSVVVVDCGTPDELSRCVKAIETQTTWSDYELVVSEHVSSPADYPAALNRAATRCTGDYLLFVSSAVCVQTPDWIEQQMTYLARPSVGVVGGKVLLPDGTKLRGSVVIPLYEYAYANQFLPQENGGSRNLDWLAHETTAVSGDLLGIKRETFAEVGGVTAGTNDLTWFVDLCLKVHELGLSVVEVPAACGVSLMRRCDYRTHLPAELTHRRRSEGHLTQRWAEVYAEADPYYSDTLGVEGYYNLVEEGY